MASGRPPRAAVRAAVRECLGDLEPGDRVVVALSGGADSLAMTAAAVVVSAEIGLMCEAVVIDHQLQAGSGEVAARAAEQARILGCSDARVLSVQVPRGSGSGGIEAAARAVRYAALDGVAAEAPAAAAILLGHTREDQAETVLLGLARGSGTRSLAGMAARAGIYRRPLLGLPRAVVAAAAREAAATDPRLDPWTDPHNIDAAFARVRVREEVLPVLEAALGPRVVEALARTASLACEDADALDSWADQVWAQVTRPPHTPTREAGPPAAQQSGAELLLEEQEPPELCASDALGGSEVVGGGPGGSEPAAAGELAGGEPNLEKDLGGTAQPMGALPIDVLISPPQPDAGGIPLPPAIVNRVVRRFLLEAGCPRGSLTAGHIRAVAALLDPLSRSTAEVALPGGRRAHREAGGVVVRV